MLRPALIPSTGKSLVVADWSGIEARVNPWLSNCSAGVEKLSLFARGEDVYKVNAAATFHVSVEEVTNEQRQIGKVQELACFTAETKVLTDNGVKAIVDVLLTDKLWDGTSWVQHQGLVYQGMKEVMTECGVQVTEAHLLRVRHGWLDAKTVLTNRSILTQALVIGSESLPFLGMRLLSQGLVASEWLSFNAHVALYRIKYSYITCLKVRLHDVMSALKNRQATGVKIISSMQMLAPMMNTADDCSIDFLRVNNGAITQKTKTILTTVGEVFDYFPYGVEIKRHFYVTSLRLKAGISHTLSWIGLTLIKGTSQIILGLSPKKKTATTSGQFKKCKATSLTLKPVYDLLNCGPNNCFTILANEGALLVHNCGFAGGVGAFAAMGRAYGILLPEPQAKRMVAGWRLANPWATPYWQDLEEAYTRAMRNKGHEFSAGRVTYMYDGQHLWYALPSGRVLCYPYAKLEADGVTYAKAAWKPAADAKEWPRARLWKGLACENITQAVANDLLRHSLRQLDDVILHIHDEIVVETDKPEAVIKQMEAVMCTPPDWAQGIPLGVEIHAMQRYGK
jgi:hypothetical protein